MKNILLFCMAVSLQAVSVAQQETQDYATYTVPAGWQKNAQSSFVLYSVTNKTTRSWCQIALYKVTASKGSVDADFESEWKTIVQPLGVSDLPPATDLQELDEWRIKSGTGSFTFNGAVASYSLYTVTGYNVCFSILINTNSEEYSQATDDFLSSLHLSRPENSQAANPPAALSGEQPTTAWADGFAFNTTNFDDGWVSAVQKDWVEVKKGAIKVLLHYPKEGTIFPADPAPLTSAAWNILVAPRYSNLKNYKSTYINNYRRVTMGMGSATDNSTQQPVFIVLFRQTAGWIEVVAPDKHTFIQYFQFDPEQIRWDSPVEQIASLDNMTGRNRFAVAASDIENTGEWNSHYASNTFWSNYYSGASEGMSTYSSAESFTFGSGQSYNWKLVATNSYGGRTSFATGKGSGTFRVLSNWQLNFSEIEGKPKTFDVYFTAVRGGRILFMNNAQFPGSGVFTGYSRKQE